jgi:hypothetical protein
MGLTSTPPHVFSVKERFNLSQLTSVQCFAFIVLYVVRRLEGIHFYNVLVTLRSSLAQDLKLSYSVLSFFFNDPASFYVTVMYVDCYCPM